MNQLLSRLFSYLKKVGNIISKTSTSYVYIAAVLHCYVYEPPPPQNLPLTNAEKKIFKCPINYKVITLGPVVQKPVNVNPGLKFNRLLYFVMCYLTT